MRITVEHLRRIWGDFSYYEGGFKRLDIEHPLECYLGYQDIDHKVIMFLTASEPKKLPDSKSILPEIRHRGDGRWTLTLKLLRNAQEGVFETLCSDILLYSTSAQDEECALKLIEQRYRQWHRLLQNQKKSLMDESSRKGLLGELLFLEGQIHAGMPVLQAVEGWVGPDGADQDFSYADSWYEIKAVGISADAITISSLEQLNRQDKGEIVVMRIDKCAPEHHGATSLANEVHKVQLLTSADADAASLFESKLTRYGYIDLEEYKEQRYVYSNQERYAVDEQFPRLTCKCVPPQVTTAKYTLSLAGIADWKLED